MSRIIFPQLFTKFVCLKPKKLLTYIHMIIMKFEVAVIIIMTLHASEETIAGIVLLYLSVRMSVQ